MSDKPNILVIWGMTPDSATSAASLSLDQVMAKLQVSADCV